MSAEPFCRRRCYWCGVLLRWWQLNSCRTCKRALVNDQPIAAVRPGVSMEHRPRHAKDVPMTDHTRSDTGTGWQPDSVNEYGTPVSVLTCASCRDTVTICPAIKDRDAWGDGCLADACPSYDLSRDVDIFFEPLAEAGLIERSSR